MRLCCYCGSETINRVASESEYTYLNSCHVSAGAIVMGCAHCLFAHVWYTCYGAAITYKTMNKILMLLTFICCRIGFASLLVVEAVNGHALF